MFKSTAVLVSAMLALLFIAGGNAAWAQSAPSVTATKSLGLSAELVDVIAKDRTLVARVKLKNNSKTRIYLVDARTDGGQTAFLGSGDHLKDPFPAGVPFCNGEIPSCLSNQYSMATEKFTYMDPGGELAMSLRYFVKAPVAKDETLSFGVALIARNARPDSDVTDVDPPYQVRFNFVFVNIRVR